MPQLNALAKGAWENSFYRLTFCHLQEQIRGMDARGILWGTAIRNLGNINKVDLGVPGILYIHMLVVKNQYTSGSGILEQFIPEWKDHEHHSSKHTGIFESIMHDHDITLFHILKRMGQGVSIALACGALGFLFKTGPKRAFHIRAVLKPNLYLKQYQFHVAYGALAGISWYIIHDLFLCNHGNASFRNHMIAYSIGGALISMTLFNPSSFVFGGMGGAFVGLLADSLNRKRGPRGFEANMPNFSAEQRERVRRDDVEKHLSYRLALSSVENTNNLVV